MAIISKKTDYLLEVKSKFTYRIFKNGSDGMSIAVQLTEDFKKASLKNFALAAMSVEDFEKRMSLEKINDLFLMLRKQISESGTYFELATGHHSFVEI